MAGPMPAWLREKIARWRRAGIDPNGPAPFYRTWSGRRGRFVVTLYREA